MALASLLGCNSVIGLNKLSVSETAKVQVNSDASAPECTSNQDCTDQLTAAYTGDGGTTDGKIPGVCLKPDGKCVQLTSEDCTTITGDYLNDTAIIVGSLFATQGTTATQNIPRQQSATLAVEEVNTNGGIPTGVAGSSRQLVMVSCNTTGGLVRAATHLVQDVRVPAIVGPNTSQDTLDVSNKVTIQAGVVVISPTAVAASITGLLDNDMTWLMIPSDDQRAKLMMKNISDLEGSLKAKRGSNSIKLSIIYRNDALGVGTKNSMDQLTLNGALLSDVTNAGDPVNGKVHIDPYSATATATDFGQIISKEVAFAPDIIVLAGTAESVTKVLTPLEQQWTAANRPYYYMIDPSKGPELLAAVSSNANDIRLRIRGTGTTPTADSAPVTNTFNLDYGTRYNSSATAASGTGPSYDAAYAIAFALATLKDQPITGANVAKGLRKLAGGSVTITTGSRDILAAFQSLASGQTITGIGTNCPLEWDANGGVLGGTIEMWCIGISGTTPLFQSSGLTYDVKTDQYAGTYTQCGQ